MRVLVTAASRYAATGELAAAIAQTLTAHGLDVTLTPPGEVDELGRFDAIVLGSAVYAGRWLEEARAFGDRFTDTLADREVWLFSSGPVGGRAEGEQPVDTIELAAAIGAHDLALFGGRIERSRLNRAERAIMRLMRIGDGDERDFERVTAWAEAIADRLDGTADGNSDRTADGNSDRTADGNSDRTAD